MSERIVYLETEHGEVLTQVSVAGLTTEPELRKIGMALIGLTRLYELQRKQKLQQQQEAK